MILYEEAQKIILDSATLLPAETVGLHDACNRILAENVISDLDMPPFNKSAVDGYACRNDDIPGTLKILGVVAAGTTPAWKVEPGSCVKVMTGAPIPEGADCVVMVENTQQIDNSLVKIEQKPATTNISYFAEDIRKGDLLIEKGYILRPQEIAVLATAGYSKVKVSVKPKVGIISTGSELVEPDEYPKPSGIRNSNGHQLVGQIVKLGFHYEYLGIVDDSAEKTEQIIQKALENNDVVLLTGGVSVGDFDFVPEIVEKLGFTIKVRKIAVQPGKPTLFAQKDNKYIFGLPGNPVSSFTIFELFVKPFLYKLCGHSYKPLSIKLPMAVDYSRRNTERLAWIPVKIDDSGSVVPVKYHGSAHINSLTSTHAIIPIAIGKKEISKGEIVDVRLI